MLKSLLKKHYLKNKSSSLSSSSSSSLPSSLPSSFKRNSDDKCDDVHSIKYWKYIQLLELCSALEKKLSCRWTHCLKISIYSASIELAYAIGFGSTHAKSFPIIEQFLRVITNIANNYYDSFKNFDNLEECLLATLAVSIYILSSSNEVPYQYLYDFYLLTDQVNLTIYDVNILLNDTIKYNQSHREKKATMIKIQETSSDMLHFKKARLRALEVTSSSQSDDTIYSKEKFNKYLTLKRPPLHHFSFLIERFEISIFGKSAWKVVKSMTKKNLKNANDDSNKSFAQVVTELLNNFFHYIKRIELKMQP